MRQPHDDFIARFPGFADEVKLADDDGGVRLQMKQMVAPVWSDMGACPVTQFFIICGLVLFPNDLSTGDIISLLEFL